MTGASAFDPSTTCCGSSCVDTLSDPKNCGACGVGCDAGAFCSEGLCIDARCKPNDPTNPPCLLDDGGFGGCCGGRCEVFFQSSDDCTRCGVNCPSGQVCSAQERCVLPDGGDGPTCATVGCPSGLTCLLDADTSQPRCISPRCPADGEVCAIPLDGGAATEGLCCNSTCVDPDLDPANCGACGRTCAPGQVCRGTCTQLRSCADGDYVSCGLDAGGVGTCCSGSCAPTNGVGNCLLCGLVCPSGSSCISGGCYAPDSGVLEAPCLEGCPSGTACRFGSLTETEAPFEGCLPVTCTPSRNGELCALGGWDGGDDIGTCCGDQCTDLTSSPTNCGDCGFTCSGDAGCVSGGCHDLAPGPCPPGWLCDDFGGRYPLDCTGLPDDDPCGFGFDLEGSCCGGRCVDRETDPNNCGTCGQACPSGVCDEGVCVPTAPSRDCNMSCAAGSMCLDDSIGTECATSTCGGFGFFCLRIDGGIGACCGLACADLSSDPLNCGECGAACPAGQTCHLGACAGACSSSALGSFCHSAVDDTICCTGGCTDPLTDDENCGYCGNGCGPGHTCDQGVCR